MIFDIFWNWLGISSKTLWYHPCFNKPSDVSTWVPAFKEKCVSKFLRSDSVALKSFGCSLHSKWYWPADHTECFVALEEEKNLNNADCQAPTCHIVTLSQSQLKEFRMSACVRPGPAPWCRPCDQSAAAGHTSHSHRKTTIGHVCFHQLEKRACCSWRFCSTTLTWGKTSSMNTSNEDLL